MRRLSAALALAVAVAACLAWAGVVVAADPVDVTVSGIVVDDGAPAAGVALTVSAISPQAGWYLHGTSAADGTFTIDIPATAGTTVRIQGLGDTVEMPPGPNGCWEAFSPTGKVEVTVDPDAPAPVTLDLDQELVFEMCPAATGRPHPEVTPPPTDIATAPRSGTSPGLLALAGLALVGSAGLLALVRRRA